MRQVVPVFNRFVQMPFASNRTLPQSKPQSKPPKKTRI
jgi:hypothetical protein